MSPSANFKRQTVAATLADALRERILNQELEEGSALRQDALASEFGVSRIPVREALLQLEGEGLVVQVAHKGYTVSVLSCDDIRELFDLRALLEVDLLRRALPQMTDEVIAKAWSIVETFDDRLKHKAEEVNWGVLNWQLHSTLYAPAGREQTMRMLQSLHRSADRYLRMQLKIAQRSNDRARSEHARLVALCEQRDGVEATRLLNEHILTARDELLDFLITRANGSNGVDDKSKDD